MTVSQKFGVPATVTESNAATLEKAEFHVRTELGISPTGYHHEQDFPIYGTGQGSANSPAMSSTLFDCYDTQAHPATYWDTQDDVRVDLGLIGFVDDCNGQTNSFADDGSPTTVKTLVAQAQANAQWAPVLVPKHPAAEVNITVRERQDDAGTELRVLSAFTAHKTLGHYKDPAGTQREQYRQLKQKSDSITAFLWEVPLTRLEAWTYYFACYLPAVSYPLASSSLSKQCLENVQRKAMSIIVPRCGFNRNTKKAILYGPLALGGASFRSLVVQQGVAQVMMFVRQWRTNSIAGKLLRIAVSWFQSQVGVSYSFLEQVHTPLPHLESKWLLSLRVFLASINAKLRLDTPYIPKLQRLHDFCIMDVIQSSGRFTPTEVCRLNYCRLYLKAMTVSDLSSIDGRVLDKNREFQESNISCSWESLPTQAVPICATHSSPGVWLIAQHSHILEVNKPPCAGTFTQYVASLSDWEKELLQYVELEVDPFSVADALEHGVRGVSDGSDWHQIQGSFGWTMSNDIGERCAYGMGPARSASPHAYRSESYGLLSLLCFLRRLAEFTGKHTTWRGVLATDSQSLIDTVLQKPPASTASTMSSHAAEGTTAIRSTPLDPLTPEWDIISGIQSLYKRCPTSRFNT
ncbi:hypothetical protein MHU86_19344 [Fragilaria crotonensis]|nr:hypothetical protein MHU86_19344 [Fragilaria crotonensis]